MCKLCKTTCYSVCFSGRFSKNDKNHELSTIVMYGFDFQDVVSAGMGKKVRKILQKSTKTNLREKHPNGNHSVGGILATRGPSSFN